MKKTLTTGIIMGAIMGALSISAQAALIISQYVETDSGTTPKGIELWNTGTNAIDFSVTTLTILKGVNGGVLSSDFTLSTGSLTAGEVMVVGKSEIGDYLASTFGIGTIQFHSKSFTFNGNDALQIQLNGVIQDTLGTPETDPVTAWSGNGVSTENQNIALKEGISTGDTDGFTDPSERFVTINSSPSSAEGLSGFGIAPVPEPASITLLGLGFLASLRHRKR
jgi:hypothetical protein